MKKPQCVFIVTALRNTLLTLCFSVSLGLTGCKTNDVQNAVKESGFGSEIVAANNFKLQIFRRIKIPNQALIIYIEGDGYAWKSPSTPSVDPTPRQPIALELAMRDPRPNIVYLARPCQYLINQPSCEDNRWWTGDRFAEPVIAAMNYAIDQIKSGKDQPIELIGFSGGGAIAIDVAARRNDIKVIRTVAGNLNPHLLNEIHDVTPMPSTVDPMQFARSLNAIPQIHYAGNDDDIVTAGVTQSFLDAAGNPGCIRRINVGASHNSGWKELWPELLKSQPVCR